MKIFMRGGKTWRECSCKINGNVNIVRNKSIVIIVTLMNSKKYSIIEFFILYFWIKAYCCQVTRKNLSLLKKIRFRRFIIFLCYIYIYELLLTILFDYYLKIWIYHFLSNQIEISILFFFVRGTQHISPVRNDGKDEGLRVGSGGSSTPSMKLGVYIYACLYKARVSMFTRHTKRPPARVCIRAHTSVRQDMRRA